ncbi:DedA family protein [Bacillus thuringiensis]|uniref:DedA family protein n=1 Tax=Bacillus thuringiensis TaxID=1428 RepID=UPI0021D686A5|nr:DedA family protein [Bacillus thuringiensis]MCU7667453.1 DedA family protein [Bacillus thuringiensis]
MDVTMLVSQIEHYGYAALFFCLWLGIIGMPIPDEVIVMCGGFVTATGVLDLVPSFLVTYAGVVSGLSLGYVLGRWIGPPVLERLAKKKNMDTYIKKAESIVHKYGPFSVFLSYFFPVVRHIVPYIVGANKLRFSKYALYSYTTGFLWTFLFFMLGRCFGSKIDFIYELFRTYSWIAGSLLLLIFFAVWSWKKYKK